MYDKLSHKVSQSKKKDRKTHEVFSRHDMGSVGDAHHHLTPAGEILPVAMFGVYNIYKIPSSTFEADFWVSRVRYLILTSV
jgi:hypothetical protein